MTGDGSPARYEPENRPLSHFLNLCWETQIKQALLAWTLVAFGAFLAWEDARFCRHAVGAFEYFLIGVWRL